MTFAARTLGAGLAFVPVTHIYGAGTWTETIPVGATKLTVELGGAGAGGGTNTSVAPAGGGGGGLCRTATLILTSADWGKTLTMVLSAGGVGGLAGNTSGGVPGLSSVSNGTFTQTVALAAGRPSGGASFGSPAGLGGGVSGGVVNTSGNNGLTGNAGGLGGAAIVGLYIHSGAGGNGNEGFSGTSGDDAAAAFAYT